MQMESTTQGLRGRGLKAFSYLRISSPEQIKGDGIRRQLDATNAYCEEHGLVLETRPMADLGISSFNGDNFSKGALGAFQIAVDDEDIKTPCALVVEKLDRISRQDIETALGHILGMIAKGVEIHTVMDRQIYRKGEMDLNKLIISIVTLYRGHEESLTKSRRLSAVWLKKREQAHQTILTRICPGWLTPREDLSGFDVIPERGAVVREIFELTAAGHSKARIAAMLNERKEPMWGRKEKKKSLRWYDTYINALLKGRTVLGELRTCQFIEGVRKYDLEPIKDYYPRVISDELYQRANMSNAAKLRHRTVYPNPDAPRNLVQGLVWLNGLKATWKNRGCRRNYQWKRPRKNSTPRYWVYFVVREPSTGKQLFTMPREMAEGMIVGRLVTIDPSDLVVAPKIDARANRRNTLTLRIKELEQGVERMVSAIKMADLASPPAALLQQMIEDERALDLANLELRKLDASYDNAGSIQRSIPKDLEAIRELALGKNDTAVREQLIRHLGNTIARVDLATSPEYLPAWCRDGAMLLAKLYRNEAEGKDAAAGWVAITLRDGTRVAGFATGDPASPKVITVASAVPSEDGDDRVLVSLGNPLRTSGKSTIPKKGGKGKTVTLRIGAGTVHVEQDHE